MCCHSFKTAILIGVVVRTLSMNADAKMTHLGASYLLYKGFSSSASFIFLQHKHFLVSGDLPVNLKES